MLGNDALTETLTELTEDVADLNLNDQPQQYQDGTRVDDNDPRQREIGTPGESARDKTDPVDMNYVVAPRSEASADNDMVKIVQRTLPLAVPNYVKKQLVEVPE